MDMPFPEVRVRGQKRDILYLAVSEAELKYFEDIVRMQDQVQIRMPPDAFRVHINLTAAGWMLVMVFAFLWMACGTGKHTLSQGAISKTTVFKNDQVNVDMEALTDSVYLRIQGADLELDFNHCVIDGRVIRRLPKTFTGIAIYIHDSKNITIKNLAVHGFKIAILAENVENLKIVNCDLSYNYRPKLYSKWDREALSDWLYYHNNENNEWKRYGAAIYLSNCDNAIVRDVICQQGMNGLLMVNCHSALVYNNNFSFNSGLGIGLYRSGHNRIMHNKLNWNARGYSHGLYARGQDSAAILMYEQSSGNVIAYNSATHSGDGLFLWAGQSTMDTGLGGCDYNVIYKNDFSQSIANGIEVTFSANFMIENKLNDSRYGIWGGYSHQSLIRGNEINDCDLGVAIEHGNFITIENNRIVHCPIGIQLWERETQPSDWPYAQVRDVRSRQYSITKNEFINVKTAITAAGTDSVFYYGNKFTSVEQEMTPASFPPIFIPLTHDPAGIHASFFTPQQLEDGMSVDLPTGTLRGRKYIIINEWGPYNFQYPSLVLRSKESKGDREVYTFAVFGPEGNWSVTSMKGFDVVTPTSGGIPDTLIAYRRVDSVDTELILEYMGEQFVDQFGDIEPGGVGYPLRYFEQEIEAEWDVAFFQYDSLSDPLGNPESFSLTLARPALVTKSYNQLAFHWWGMPLEGVPADQFAVRATTDITTMTGEYLFQVESDDGIKLWLDGELILERWNVHTPMIDEITVPVSAGRHHVEVEYFDAGGLAVLDMAIVRNFIGR